MRTAERNITDLAQAIGERIRSGRVASGETQAVVGGRFGVTKMTVSRWERGIALPPLDVVVEVAHDYGFSLADLTPPGRREVPSVEQGTPRDVVEMPPTEGTRS